MPFSAIVRCLIALAAVAGAAPAFADLKSYNAAVLRGDFANAANEAQATWPTLDKARADIHVIAREFGWTAMIAERPQIAKDVMTSAAALPVANAAPHLSAVLTAWADFKIKSSGETRRKLLDALKARSLQPHADYISVRASQELFRDEWDANRMTSAAESAEVGAKLAGELGEEMVDVNFAMRRYGLVSRFIQRPERADFVGIAELAGEIRTKLLAETDGKKRELLVRELANTIAWQGVERNVLNRRNVNLPDNIAEGDVLPVWFPAPGDPSVPECRISIDTGELRPKYPRMAQSKGLPGYAIYSFEVGEAGAFKSARVLGSAPHESFTETIDEILPAWRWRMNSEQTGSCRMPQQHVVHFIFSLR